MNLIVWFQILNISQNVLISLTPLSVLKDGTGCVSTTEHLTHVFDFTSHTSELFRCTTVQRGAMSYPHYTALRSVTQLAFMVRMTSLFNTHHLTRSKPMTLVSRSMTSSSSKEVNQLTNLKTLKGSLSIQKCALGPSPGVFFKK